MYSLWGKNIVRRHDQHFIADCFLDVLIQPGLEKYATSAPGLGFTFLPSYLVIVIGRVGRNPEQVGFVFHSVILASTVLQAPTYRLTCRYSLE